MTKLIHFVIEIQFSHVFIFKFGQGNQIWKMDTINKMDNPRFADEETIPLVQYEDYDDYITPDTSRVDETSLTEREATEATSILQLRQEVKRDKITALYRHLNVTGGPGLVDRDRLMIKKNSKTGNSGLLFFDSNQRQSLTNKRTGEFGENLVDLIL